MSKTQNSQKSLRPNAAAPARTISAAVVKRIAGLNRGAAGPVITPFDLLDLGSPHSVGMVLTRLVRAGTLRRVARGLYSVRREHPVLGERMSGLSLVMWHE